MMRHCGLGLPRVNRLRCLTQEKSAGACWASPRNVSGEYEGGGNVMSVNLPES